MTIMTVVGAYAGLGLLVLMALAPLLVDLEQRFPDMRGTKAPEREGRIATPVSA
ncbi:hypothetical protein [Amycolatopsis pigmentata]|uniref:Uncharacterized protein n=1 Tax=Amycolatopsis pigmentata TaxID=450801 RepID=A0ABW5FMR6_9PSEU